MSDSQPRLLLEELRAKLTSLTEALFQNASFVQGQFAGAGPRLASLCRGPATADKTLQTLEQRWDSLQGGVRSELAAQWESNLSRMAQRIREARDGCGCTKNSNSEYVSTSCAICRPKVAAIADDLEVFTMSFAGKLDAEERVMGRRHELEEIQKRDATIRRLEDDCRTLKDEVEQKSRMVELLSTQQSTQRKTLEETQDSKREFEMTCHMLEEELGESIDSIEKCADDLRKAERWDMAERAYDTLHRLLHAKIRRMEHHPALEGARRDIEIRSLKIDHFRVLALRMLSRYSDAEELAKQVWLKRKEFLLENSEDVRDVFLTYCELLTRNDRAAVAEKEYIFGYYAVRESTDPKDIEWKLVIMSQLGKVMGKQGKYDEAAIWHRKVLDERIAAIPMQVNKAANSAAELLRTQQKLAKGFTIIDHKMKSDLDKIWRLRERGNEQPDVLYCGLHLGIRLKEDGKDEEAANAYWDVWDRYRQLGKGNDTLTTTRHVEPLLIKLKNLPRLEVMYEWLRKYDGSGHSEVERTWSQYKLGCVQAVSENLSNAESTLQDAVQRRTALSGWDDPEVLQQIQVFCEVLKRLHKYEAAKERLRETWDRRQHLPEAALHTILRIGHLYGDMLMESIALGDLDKAAAVLRDTWDRAVTSLARIAENGMITKRNQHLYGGVMTVGDCFGICLMKQKKYNTAKEILTAVLERKKDLYADQTEMDKTEHLIKKARDLRGSRHPSPSTAIVDTHPLDLAHLLSHWSTTNGLAEAPANRGPHRGLIESS